METIAKTINEAATGREVEPKDQVKQILENNRNMAGQEITEILKKYDCNLTANMLITPSGCVPKILILNNNNG